jgi:uncharacterized membrane protein YsdA (DUF1294 family)
VSDLLLIQIGAAWLIIINAATFFAFGWDKRQAERGRRRFPEYGLIRLAALGGAPGGWLGMWAFRHKTQKQPFGRRFADAFITQMVVVAALVVLKVTLSS